MRPGGNPPHRCDPLNLKALDRMNPKIGWALAALGTVLGYHFYGGRGIALAVSAMVFWLLLQFSKALRTMRAATQAPVGRVPSAVMLHAKLAKGMRLMALIQFTRSLGEKLGDDPETYVWRDGSGASVTVQLAGGKVTQWTLARPEVAPEVAPEPALAAVASSAGGAA